VLPDLRATILGPPADWGDEKLRVPAFVSLPIERKGASAPFHASLALHALIVLTLPVILRSLPPDPDKAFQTRLGASLQHALILRVPDRIYVPVQSKPLADVHPAARLGEIRGLLRTRQLPSATGSSVARPPSQPLFRTILIQPGKTIADDLRTKNLPSLLYLSDSKPPAPQEPVNPSVHAQQAPLPTIPTITPPHGAVSPEPPPAPSPSPIVADSTLKAQALPSLPLPSAWSLVSHGAGGESAEGPAHETQPASGADVAVLSIASSVPQPQQLVEIPPVNQPRVAGGTRPSGSMPELREEGKQPAPPVSSTAPPMPDRHGALPAGKGDPRGTPAGEDKHPQPEAQSEGRPIGSQARAFAPSQARMLKTRLGMAEVLNLPSGTQQIKFPPGGSFDIVIVESSPSATIPDAERLLTGRPVQTVYLTLGTGQDWILQYCLPAARSGSGQSGMLVTLGRQPKMDSPFIQQAFIPPQIVLRATQPALFQGVLGANGRFVHLRPVLGADFQSLPELLPYLEQWQFRPAKVDGVPGEVEVLLLVPPSLRP